MKRIYAALTFFAATQCTAAGSPWLLNPGDSALKISYVSQYADRLWLGTNRVPIPGGELEQDTVWLAFDHGLTDNLALDFQSGYARTDQENAPGDSGYTDTSFGLTWRFHDEFLHDNWMPSAALRVGGIIKGDYDTGFISAIGDGASGAEVSLVLGRVITDTFAISSEFGYRWRDGTVPNEHIVKLNGYYSLSPNLSVNGGYEWIDAKSGLDIAGPGFTPARFPDVEEDLEIVSVGATYSLTQDLSFGVDYGQLVDGRNAPESDFASFNVGYSF